MATKRRSSKANLPERRERRQEMREALSRAVHDPEFIREMEETGREWDAVVGDGLEDIRTARPLLPSDPQPRLDGCKVVLRVLRVSA